MFIVTWVDLGKFNNAQFFNEHDALDHFELLKLQLGPHVKSIVCNTADEKELWNYILWVQDEYKRAINTIHREREEHHLDMSSYKRIK